MDKFNLTELAIVRRWLNHMQALRNSERMEIECGDDYAMLNNKWPRVQELKAEEDNLRGQIKFVNELFVSQKNFEEKIDEQNTTD